MEVQRRYNKVMEQLEEHKNGIAEIEDDDFDFLDRKFHQHEMSVQRDISKILVGIEDALNKAKVKDDKNESGK